MIRNLILTFFLLGTLEIQAQVTSHFSYSEWEEIFSTRRCPQDFVVLSDGTKLCGTLEKIPPLDYSFGSLDFDAADLAAISVTPNEPLYKVQYISRDGQNFIGHYSKGKFAIWIDEPTLKNPNQRVKKEIDPKIVSYILLKERKPWIDPSNRKISSIELKNGDYLPAFLNEMIQLSNGWKDKTLNPNDIVELSFNGGLHGHVVENGHPVDLGFMFVKDRFLTVQISTGGQTFRLPWDAIAAIQGKNGGFKRDPTNPASKQFSRPLINDLEEALLSGVRTTKVDSIGNTRGMLLKEVTGGVPLSSAAFEGLELLGNETWTPEALFQQEKEESWVMNITFEEDNDEVDIQPFLEAFIFESIPRVDVDPESFDYISEAEENPKCDFSCEIESKLTPEALVLIEEVMDDEELDFYYEKEEDGELTDDALMMIEDILYDEELDEIKVLKSPSLEDIAFIVQPDDNILARDIFWDDIEGDLTHDELALLNELFD